MVAAAPALLTLSPPDRAAHLDTARVLDEPLAPATISYVPQRPIAVADQHDDPVTRIGIIVDLARQKAYVYRGVDLVISAPISSGRRGYETPHGTFAILEKAVWHRSTIYSGAPMPYMERLTWSGVAFHAGGLPGYRQSHGCIHLSRSVARRLFGMTRIGTMVVVSHGLPGPPPTDGAIPSTPWAAATMAALAL